MRGKRFDISICIAGAAILALAAITVSCGPLFNSVRVVGSPSIYAPLGSQTIEMADFFAVQGMTDSLNEALGGNGRAYDFVDTSSPAQQVIQKILVHYPLVDVPIDFAQYLEEIDLGGSIDVGLPEQSFTVPALAANMDSVIAVDVNQTLVDTANAGMLPITVSVPETGSATPQTATVTGTATADNFTSVTFTSGTYTLDFSVALAEPTSDVTLTLTRITLMNGATVLAQADYNENLLAPGASASLPLAGMTLPAVYQVRFTVSTTGGVSGTLNTITALASLSADTAVSQATGLDFTQNLTLVPETVPLGIDPAYFYGADIGSGSMILGVTGLPGTGFSISLDADIAQAGGIAMILNQLDTPIDLAGEHISNAAISFSGDAVLSAANATITVPPSGMINITCNLEVDIASLSSLTVIPETPLDLSETVSQDMGPDILEWVQSVYFTEVGLNMTLNNGLPGNTIDVGLVAPDFGMPVEVTRTFPAGTTTQSFIQAPHTMIIDGALDFVVDMSLSGYDELNNRLTMTNVSSGQVLSIGGSVELVADWASVTLNQITSMAGQFPDDALDMAQALEPLSPGVDFASIPLYVYASGLDQDFMSQLNIELEASYTIPSISNVDLLPGTNNLVALPLALPDPFGTPEGVYQGTLPVASLPAIELASIINARPADLVLNYNVSSGPVTINRADADDGETLKMELVLVFPFSFVVADPDGAEIIIEGLEDGLGQGEDLFGRTGADEEINDLLDQLQSMTLTAVIVNGTGMNLEAALSDGAGFQEGISIATGRQDLILDQSDIAYIRDTVPFNPYLRIIVPQGTWAFRRDASLSATLSVTAVTDIDRTFDLGGED